MYIPKLGPYNAMALGIALELAEFCYSLLVARRSLLEGVSQHLPGAFHSHCCQHIADNVLNHFGKKCWELFGHVRTPLHLRNSMRLFPKSKQKKPKLQRICCRSLGNICISSSSIWSSYFEYCGVS